MSIEEILAKYKDDLDVYPELVYLFAGYKEVSE